MICQIMDTDWMVTAVSVSDISEPFVYLAKSLLTACKLMLEIAQHLHVEPSQGFDIWWH